METVEELKAENARLQKEIEELEEKIDDLEFDLLNAETEADELQNQIEDLQTQVFTKKTTETVEVWKDELWEKVRDKYTLQELETLLNRE